MDPKLFFERENDEQVVFDKIEVDLQFLDNTDFKKFLIKYCVLNMILCKFHKNDNIDAKILDNLTYVRGLYMHGRSHVSQLRVLENVTYITLVLEILMEAIQVQIMSSWLSI